MGEMKIRVRIPASHPAHAQLSRLPAKERSKWISQSMHFYGQAIAAAAANLGGQQPDAAVSALGLPDVPTQRVATHKEPARAAEVLVPKEIRAVEATNAEPLPPVLPSPLAKPQNKSKLSSVVRSAVAVALSEQHAAASA